jgi:hypothetical protein
MHQKFNQFQPNETGMPIRGTFYPSRAASGAPSLASALPKLLILFLLMAVVRNVAAAVRSHGGSPRSSRRREALAALHRDLHDADPGAD